MTQPTLLLSPAQAQQLRAQASQLPSIALQAHELAALELLMQGALAPLRGFNTQADSTRPMLPLQICGQSSEQLAAPQPDIGDQLALQDSEGVTLAVLQVEQLQRAQDSLSIGGAVRGIQMPTRDLFAQFQMGVDALRGVLSSAHGERTLCVHIRGALDEQGVARLKACDEKTRLLLRILDGGDPDQAHQLKRTLDGAQDLREELGVDRCLIVLSPDPSPQQDSAQQALDECFAQNIGCTANLWLSAAHASQTSARQGTCIFFTGLSGSGKSTLARALHAHLVHNTDRAVTLLDGDVVRQQLSKGLGFSRSDRDLNVQRIGYVASRVVMHGGLVICAPIAPYAKTRATVRAMIEQYGRFIEVHVSTDLAVCETRDRKGLYEKARAGKIKEFTGISDPYEAPEHAEFTIDTDVSSVNDAVNQIAQALIQPST